MPTRKLPTDAERQASYEEFRTKAKKEYGIDFATPEEVEEAKANKMCWQGMSIADVGEMFSNELILAAHLLQFMASGYEMGGEFRSANAAKGGFNVLRDVSAAPWMDKPYRDYLTHVGAIADAVGLGGRFIENTDPADLDKSTWEVLDNEVPLDGKGSAIDDVFPEISEVFKDLLGEALLEQIIAHAGSDVPDDHTPKPKPPIGNVIPFGRMKPQA